jgi:hypothetical protein
VTAVRGPQSWDERWLPRAAARTQAWAASLRRRLDELAGPHSLVGEGARTQPALAGSAAAVLVAGIVLAVAGGPGGPKDDNGSASGPPPVSPVPVVGTTLGPPPGMSVTSYRVRAAADLRHYGDIARGRPTFAVVDLGSYVTPATAERMFNGLKVERAYVRVPVSGLPTQVHAIPLQDTFASLTPGMLASGRLAAATARTFEVLVTQMSPSTPRAKELKARYAVQEHASAAEGQRLQTPGTCACVFSVVVRGNPAQLAALAGAKGVRVVDPAPPTATLDVLTIFPLEPDVTTVVPKGGLFGA